MSLIDNDLSLLCCKLTEPSEFDDDCFDVVDLESSVDIGVS